MDCFNDMRRLTVGILGGMGPLATADLMVKIIEETRADRDQDHVPVIAASLPQMPSRIDAIVCGGPTPLPAMIDVLRRLERGGADLFAMPCNTAHFWYEELARSTRLPFLHIADGAVAAIAAGHRRIGVLASSATVQAGIYAGRLRRLGREPVVPDPVTQTRADAAIAAVKAGAIAKAEALLRPIAVKLADAGAESIILGCTEFPIALRDPAARAGLPPLIDATRALARACVAASAPDRLLAGAAEGVNTGVNTGTLSRPITAAAADRLAEVPDRPAKGVIAALPAAPEGPPSQRAPSITICV